MLAGMKSISRPSPAKINLTLKVGPTREDGFHEVESLVVRVGLCDTVTVTPRNDGQLTLSCDDPSIPCDGANLALQAARLLAETVGTQKRGVHIELAKRIPAGAGLGGGSSNAATTLMLLNKLWESGLSGAELAEIGARIGSDLPLFFHTPLCVMRGRGELVEDVQYNLDGWVVLVLPDIHVSTPEVYAAWDRLEARTYPKTGFSPARCPCHNGFGIGSSPTRPATETILQKTDSITALMPLLFNDLQPAALAINPDLARVAEELDRVATDRFLMTGSGAAFFGLFEQREAAEKMTERIRQATGLRTAVAALNH